MIIKGMSFNMKGVDLSLENRVGCGCGCGCCIHFRNIVIILAFDDHAHKPNLLLTIQRVNTLA